MNPGPEILPLCLYMLSFGIKSHIRGSPETGITGCQSDKSRYLRLRPAPVTSPRVDAPIPAMQAEAGGTAQQLTLPVRSYNRLRLYLSSVIFTS